MASYRKRFWGAVGAALLAGAVLAAPAPAQAAGENFALAMRWHGHVYTDLQFSEFFQQDHTVAVRFMQQYPRAYEGAILAVNGTGTYAIGQGDYEGDTFEPGDDATRLLVKIGGQRATYTLPFGLVRGVWHHLAVVRTSGFMPGFNIPVGRYKLYLDGIYRPKDGGGDLTVSSLDSRLPSGWLRFGTTDASPKTADSQFYGLIDDVAVFDEALSPGQIAGLAAIARLFGGEPHLLAGYTFDAQLPSGQPLPAKMKRKCEIKEPAYKTPVTPTRNSFADRVFMPRPAQQVAMRLPFAKGQVWYVAQGWEGTTSHHGYATFCWDFAYAVIHPVFQVPTLLVSSGKGQPVYASAPGTVRIAEDDGDSAGTDDPNSVRVEQAPNEFTSYRHVLTGSVTELGIQAGTVLALGQKLAEVGTNGGANGYHLHMGSANREEVENFRTIPVEFSNYEYWDADDGIWRFIARGVPLAGQFVRRPWYVFDLP